MQKWQSIFKRFAVLILIPVVGQGCLPHTATLPASSTERTLYALSHTIAAADILSMIARIDLVTRGGSYPATAVLLIKKPSYLRLELLPLIGPPDFFLAATPARMRILLPAKAEFYEGDPSVRNLSRFLPWEFNIEEMVAIFASTYPPFHEAVTYRGFADDSTLRVEIKALSGNFETIRVDSNNRLLRLARFNEYGNELYSARFEDYQDGSPLARKITITMADGVTSLTLRYSDLKIEKSDDLSVFDLPRPDGFQTILMD